MLFATGVVLHLYLRQCHVKGLYPILLPLTRCYASLSLNYLFAFPDHSDIIVWVDLNNTISYRK